MNSYEERKQAKIDRYRELAAKKQQESESTLNQAKSMSDIIPFGQPILVGHHSEKRDRNYRDRIHNTYGKGYELEKTANYYEEKANRMEKNKAISSDDPEAIEKLKVKLANMEASRQKNNELNKRLRRDKIPYDNLAPNKLKELGYNENDIKYILHLVQIWRHKDLTLPKYLNSNLSQNMGTVKKRIKELETKSEMTTKEYYINDIKIVENVEANRLQIFFDDIPEKELRTKLKSYGFRWSPTNKSWQAYLNGTSIYRVNNVIFKEL